MMRKPWLLLFLLVMILLTALPSRGLANIAIPALDLARKLTDLADRGRRLSPDEIAQDQGFLGELAQLKEIDRFTMQEESFPNDLEWIAVAWRELRNIGDQRRRTEAAAAILDCLEGLARSFRTEFPAGGLTPEQMREALQRAFRNCRPVGSAIPAEVSPGGRPSACQGQVLEGFEGQVIAARFSGETGETWSGGGSGGSSGGSGGSGGSSGSGGEYVGGGSSGSGGSSGGGTSGGNSSSGGSSSGGHSSSGGSNATSGNPGSSNRPGGSVSQPSSYQRPQQGQITVTPPQQRPSMTQTQRPYQPPPPPPTPQPKPPEPPKPPDPGPQGGAKFLFWLVAILVILLFIGLLVYLFLTFRKNLKGPPPVTFVGNVAITEEQFETPTLFQEAISAAEKGQFDRAIRLMTLASMLMLDEAHVLAFDKHLTNGEYLDGLRERAAQDVSGLWHEPLRRFDRLIYGFNKPDRQDFEVFKTLYLNLKDRKR